MKEFDVMRPYKLNEIAKIDRELKATTFKEMLEKGEDCPEGMKPIGTDGRQYMKKYLEDLDSGEIFNSSQKGRSSSVDRQAKEKAAKE